jgi:hypothetical protein
VNACSRPKQDEGFTFFDLSFRILMQTSAPRSFGTLLVSYQILSLFFQLFSSLEAGKNISILLGGIIANSKRIAFQYNYFFNKQILAQRWMEKILCLSTELNNKTTYIQNKG